MTDASDPARRLLDAALRAGAGAADVLSVRRTSLSVDVLGGRLEHADRAEATEIGLRVLVGRRQACVASSDLSDATLAEMAERAVAMARAAPEDPFCGLAGPDELSPVRDAAGLAMADPAPEPEPDALFDHAARAEAAALAVRGVSRIDQVGAAHGRHEIRLVASTGFDGGYARTDTGISCVAITGEGTRMERDWATESRIFAADLPAPEEIGRRAGERTVARAGARKPPTGAFPVLYDERVASGLIGHLLSATNGLAVARGASWARTLAGERVLPAGLSLREDPHRPRTPGSRPFDAEGLRTRPREIVADGILQGWTLDLASARQLGLASTANAGRGTSAPPAPTNHNIALTQGARSRDDLLREMGTGLLVTSFLGASINATTGDYSRGAAGFWVEGGEIAYPVNECTIAGNLRPMLLSLVPANDARPWLSRVVPSCLVEGLTIAGA